MQVKDVMTRDVKLADPEMTIQEAARMMRDGDFGALPVGENDRLVGVVTDRDIATRCCAEGKDPTQAHVRDVMSQSVRWTFDDASTDEAADIMRKHQIKRIPVINHDKRLVGIVALADLAVEGSQAQSAAQALSGISRGAERHH